MTARFPLALTAPCLALALALAAAPAEVSAQIVVLAPRVSFSVTARLRVPRPGVLVVHDLGREIAVVGGAYWVETDGGWAYAVHPHHRWYFAPAPPLLVGVTVRAPLLPVGVWRHPGGPPLRVKLKGPHVHAHGPIGLKIKGGPGRSKIEIKQRGGAKVKIKGPPPGHYKGHRGGGKGPATSKGHFGGKGKGKGRGH